MKIVTLSTRYSTGGAQLNSLLVADELRKRGHESEAVFLMRAGEMKVPEGLPIRIMSDRNSHSLANVLKFTTATISAIREIKPDVIIGFHPMSNIVGSIAAGMVPGTRFIATQRNPASSQGALTGRIEALLGSTSLYDSNIAVTKAVADSYGRHRAAYQRKITVIHNGTPALEPVVGQKEDLRRSLNLPSEGFTIGALGRLAEQKNPLFLLDVLSKLPPGYRLAFAGDGPLRNVVQEKAESLSLQSRVHILGELHGADVSGFYSAIDLFALPSNFEGFGRTLVEAMSKGTPVLAHSMPVTEEVVGTAGDLLPLDADSWAQHILRLSSSPTRLMKMEELGRQRAASFSINSMIDGYEQVAARAQPRLSDRNRE